MKIGIVVRGLNREQIAALPRNVIEISKRLEKRAEVVILTDGRRNSEYKLNGIKVCQVIGSNRTLESINNLANLSNRMNIDVVNFHGSLVGGVFAAAAWKKLEMPLILNLYSFKVQLQDLRTLKLSDVRFPQRIFDDIVWMGSFIPSVVLRHYLTHKSVKRIIVPSARMRVLFDGILRQEKLVCNIPPGVDLETFKKGSSRRALELKEELGFSKNDKVVLHSGLTSMLRGADDTIFAMQKVVKKVPQAKLLLAIFPIGKSSQYMLNHTIYIRNLASQYLPRNLVKIITFPTKRMKDFYGLSDLVVLPYRFVGDFPECPLTLIEAMACEKVVITTKIGAIPEYVPTKECLCVPKDVVGLAETTTKILSNSELSGQIGETNRKFVEKKHNWEMISQEMEEIYKEAYRDG